MTESLSHVIILGCGRSGTSIFGEFFEDLLPYAYFSEPSFDDLIHFNFSQPTAIKVPKESSDYPPTLGLSFPLETLLNVIPDPKILYWQVRHPLDAICSLRVGIANNWGHHPKPPDWQAWQTRPLIERCAHHWNYLNSVGFEEVAPLVQVKHFETMLQNPLVFAHKIAAEVGIDIPANRVEIESWANRVQNTNNQHFIEAKTSRNYSRPDHKTRVDRWKENLSDDEVRQILSVITKTARKFGYKLPSYK
jgi:hypothetical protein